MIGPLASSNFSTLSCATAGLYASGGGLGYAFGGLESAGTNSQEENFNLTGMVLYNLTSKEWLNISATGYSYSKTTNSSATQFVPSFGPAGLLLDLGGSIGNNTLAAFNIIYMFDPSSQQWSFQQISGEKSAPVSGPCVVGAPSDDDTYEIRHCTDGRVLQAQPTNP